MKKLILLIVVIGNTFGIKAQITELPNGNVGIGTSNPTVSLDIKSDANSNWINLNDGSGHSLGNFTRSGNGLQIGTWSGGTSHLILNPNGNIGIGTSNPDKKLTVFGNVRLGSEGLGGGFQKNGVLIQSNGTRTELRWQHYGQNINPYIAVDPGVDATRLIFGTNGNDQMAIRGNGNVGIGTTNPQEKLQIGNNGFTLHDGGHKVFTFNPYTTNYGSIRYDVPNKRFTIETVIDGSLKSHMHIVSNGDVIVNNKIGIGASPGEWQLAVNGKIRAKEIKVETEWSDFVFKKEYDLPTLIEVETHIKEKGHLIDIPSAKEVAENGIYLGEMDSKLLQKIEELTLYTIQQQKEIENLKKENEQVNTLKEMMFALLTRLKKLESKD